MKRVSEYGITHQRETLASVSFEVLASADYASKETDLSRSTIGRAGDVTNCPCFGTGWYENSPSWGLI